MLGNEDALWFLFIVLALIAAYAWNFYAKFRALKSFAQNVTLKRINASVNMGKQVFKAILAISAFVLIVIALTRPLWNPRPREVKRKGRDVVILLDTSRSMLAADIKPNRLERAKLAISDLMETLPGDRIAIITFAGNSTVKCPLTQDYGFVKMILTEIDTQATGRGGTNIGDAIREASERLFDGTEEKYRDIILITDGGDHETFPADAAAKAGQNGIRIITIGLGDDKTGARVPEVDANGKPVKDSAGNTRYLQYQDEDVWVKLGPEEEKILVDIATATPGGRYIPVRTGAFDLGAAYEELVSSAQKHELEETTVMEYDERFQVFLVLAIIILIFETMAGERKKT